MTGLWRISATEVKNSWGRVVQQVLRTRKPALVESKGVPTVVILPADEYEQLIAGRDAEARRQQQILLLDEVERFAKKVAAGYLREQVPGAVDLIRELREERDAELTGLR